MVVCGDQGGFGEIKNPERLALNVREKTGFPSTDNFRDVGDVKRLAARGGDAHPKDVTPMNYTPRERLQAIR